MKKIGGTKIDHRLGGRVGGKGSDSRSQENFKEI